ncbi:MAG: GNAT family N-acetyltransferase [Anaerolineae bacterium]|nr:GNAT family N-acetyltransferase [Anaerolineae bacterium]
MRFNLSIIGVLTWNNPGTVYVDQPDMPHVVLVMSPEGSYLAGDAPSADQVSSVKNQVVDLMENDAIEALWLTCDPAWQLVLDECLPRPPLRVPRQHYVCTTPAFDWRSYVPEGFAVHRIDQALLARADLTIPDHVHDWIESNWGTREDFFARGFGFVTETLDIHKVVSWSLCDCIGDHACEIGIHTHPDYRRQGLAALTSAAAVDYALAQGLSMVGWHCSTDNIGSQYTALRVGFTLERDYVSFAAFRREAVHWSEAGRSQEVIGDSRAAAEYYIRADACGDKPAWGHYIPFYAACAFAKLGDYDSAWTWLHRAVAQGFDDMDTLQSVAALTPMRATPAWNSLLQSIEGDTDI